MQQRCILSALFLFLAVSAGAQQLAHYSLFWLDPAQFNPAYAGLDNSLSMTGTYRSQWTGIDGQPTGQRLSAHLPVYYLSSGVGVTVERDQLGARSLNRFGVSYNYQLVRPTGVWSLGVSARFLQLSIDGAALRTPGGDYSEPGVILHNDELLPNSESNEGSLGIDAGVFYQGETFEGGVSARNLNSPTVEFPGLSYELGRQYHAYLRARFDLIRGWDVSPMAFAYSNGTQHQVSLGASLRYNENIFAGASYRGYNDTTSDAIVIFGGFNLSEKVMLAYAYDLTISDLRGVQDGSHEITLKYNLRQRIGAGVPPPVIFHPRM